jgi:hypothetical protein
LKEFHLIIPIGGIPREFETTAKLINNKKAIDRGIPPLGQVVLQKSFRFKSHQDKYSCWIHFSNYLHPNNTNEIKS